MSEQNTVAVPVVGNAVILDQKSSVEISKNAKGDFQYTIKVYDMDPDQALAKAIELKKSIEEKINS